MKASGGCVMGAFFGSIFCFLGAGILEESAARGLRVRLADIVFWPYGVYINRFRSMVTHVSFIKISHKHPNTVR